MIFTKDLLLKGLAGLAVCGGATTIGVHYYTGGFSSSSSEVKVTEGNLGLPADCRFPAADGAAVTCTLTADNINNIEFDGKNSSPALTGTGTLQISIPGNDEKDIFPFGYKVTITASPGDITITRSSGNIVLKANQATDFKIKQNANKTFSLEKAWTAEDLAKKVGLEKSNDHWTVGSKAIKVKYESGNAESKTASPAQEGVTQGKIKAYVETTATTYNKGIKFVIEDGDIALTNGDAGTSITKLEQFETYEIRKEESDGWVLVRKSKASEEIKKALGLPTENCNMPESAAETECTSLDEAKLTAIKFEGKGNGNVTVTDISSANLKLKISKTADTNFTFGYKFVLESAKDITISQSSGTPLTIKAGTNTEFKIKKTVTNGNTALTLEKAWTIETLGKKINLTNCTTEGTKQCDFGTSINVYDEANSKVTGATFTAGSTEKKITYELGQDNYNQGIKFTVGENISIQNGTAPSGGTSPTQICNNAGNGTPSYEIKEIGGTWYLAKKS